jgi:hypothetical protein
MDDKTSSRLQPSTTFDDSFQSTTHSVVRPLTSSPTYPSTTFNKYFPAINQRVSMEPKDTFDPLSARTNSSRQFLALILNILDGLQDGGTSNVNCQGSAADDASHLTSIEELPP